MVLKKLIHLFFWSILSLSALAQNVSNEGTIFYAVFPTHVPANINGVRPLANYSVFITGKSNSSGKISAGSFTQTFTVSANSITEIQIPRAAAYIDESEAGQVINKAIKIEVDAGMPKVVVYGHIFAGARSAASLILPQEALGQQYYTMNYYTSGAKDTGHNFIVVIANEANTKLFLRKDGNDLVQGGITLARAGDVYEYLDVNDLTGTEIIVDPQTSACKKFAVFSGNTNSLIGSSSCAGESSDPLYQQNYPVESWGTTYGFIPFSTKTPWGFATRTNGSYYRILAKDDGTKVYVDGEFVKDLNSGDYYQPINPSSTPSLITANRPIAVAQYALSQSCAGTGFSDPDMVILNPVEYNIKDITVYSSSRENISQQFINILIKTSDAASFRINGSPPTQGFTYLPSSPEYSYLALALNSYSTSNFNLSANSGFNAIAYGFGDVESYSYSAGTNLASSISLLAVRNNRTEQLTNACTNEDFEFKVVLQAMVSKLVWKFGDEPEIIQNNPQAYPVNVGDKTVYEYYYPKTEVFFTPGQRLVKLTAEYGTANSCAIGTQQIEINFNVFNPSTPLFTAPANACPGNEVLFEDKSIGDEEKITKWAWDFGDGQISTQQSPKHIFNQPGIYTVKLSSSGASECAGSTYEQLITITQTPVAKFTSSIGKCESNAFVFTDYSDPKDGVIKKWLWDFGDNETLEKVDNFQVAHNYKKVGSYVVKLIVENNSGCQSAAFTDTVNTFAPFLEAGPDRYVLKGGKITLTITSDGNDIVYIWKPTENLNNSDIKNPTVSPKNDQTYMVTILTKEGCSLKDSLKVIVVETFEIYNTFTPNGDGVNDFWVIKYLDTYTEATIDIFNRYGAKVFSSVGYTQPWDGRYLGKELPVGTYYYIIDPKIENLKPVSGSVTIIR